jgi:hypothetical protein
MQDDLTIPLFFFTCAFLAVVEAMKASGWRLYAFGALGVLTVAIGLAWQWIKGIYPPLTNWIVELATSAQSWFLLAVLGFILIAITGRRREGRETRPTSETNDIHGRMQEIIFGPKASFTPDLIDYLARVPDELRQQRNIVDDVPNKLQAFQSDVSGLTKRLTKIEEALRPSEMMRLGELGQPKAKDRFEELERRIVPPDTRAAKDLNDFKNAVDLRSVNEALFRLLELEIAYNERVVLIKCLENQPIINDLPVANWTETFLTEQGRIYKKYINDVIAEVAFTRWVNDHNYKHLFFSAETEAKQMARKIATELPAGINPFDAEGYLQARFVAVYLISFVERTKRDFYDDMAKKHITTLAHLREAFEKRFTNS